MKITRIEVVQGNVVPSRIDFYNLHTYSPIASIVFHRKIGGYNDFFMSIRHRFFVLTHRDGSKAEYGTG